VTKAFFKPFISFTFGILSYRFVLLRFKDHVKKNSPQKIIDVEEFFNLRNEVVSEIKASKAEVESKISDDAPPGEEAPDNLDKVGNRTELKRIVFYFYVVSELCWCHFTLSADERRRDESFERKNREYSKRTSQEHSERSASTMVV
jgi:hypothetical protein